MAENTSTQLVLGLTAQIVSAHVSNNAVSRDALPELIQQVFTTLMAAGVEQVEPEKLQRPFRSRNRSSPSTSSVLKMARSSRC